jgi:hypothetical protein
MGSIANLAKLEPLSRMSQNLNMVAFIWPPTVGQSLFR